LTRAPGGRNLLAVPSISVVIATVGLWIAAALAARRLWSRHVARTLDGDSVSAALWIVEKLLCRVVHRLKVVGREHVPPTNRTGGLVVVANHTGGVDPLLIQSACPFLIRWLMASDMISPSLRWVLDRKYVIPVDRDGRDSGPLREAMRTVKAGGVVGIFPEGGIVDPPEEIRPFEPGTGLIVARCGAPVLLVWVSGTPHASTATGSILARSRATVRFLGTMSFKDERDPGKITAALRAKLAEASGWPLNDEPMPLHEAANVPATMPA
jgi:1-acyl-sn-glycerol-3-phosphate acyltransferase